MSGFRLDLPPATSVEDLRYPPKALRRSWTRDELVAVFPEQPLSILDVGAGDNPFRARPEDTVVTVDFDPVAEPDHSVDVTRSWPFEPESFDFVYMSHVVEHLYPQDRDALIRNVYESLRPEGFVFIRVPHKSSIQGVGWEHHSLYGLNSAASLSHGRNPLLPMFRSVSVGVATTTEFGEARGRARAAVERALNASWRLTDGVLCYAVGGIAEVQFLLQRLEPSLESRLRATPASAR